MNLKYWWDLSSLVTAEQTVDQEHLGKDTPIVSVTDDEASFLYKTFLFPVTMGLSTAVISVLLIFKNRITTGGPTIRDHGRQAISLLSMPRKRKSNFVKNVSCSGSLTSAKQQDRTVHKETIISIPNSASQPVMPQKQSTPIGTIQPPLSAEQEPLSSKKSKKRSTKSKRRSSASSSTVADEFMKNGFLGGAQLCDDHNDTWVTVTPKRMSRPQNLTKRDKAIQDNTKGILSDNDPCPRQTGSGRPASELSGLSVSTGLLTHSSASSTVSPAVSSPLPSSSAAAVPGRGGTGNSGSGEQNRSTTVRILNTSTPVVSVGAPVTAKSNANGMRTDNSAALLPKEEPTFDSAKPVGDADSQPATIKETLVPSVAEPGPTTTWGSNATCDLLRQHTSAQLRAKELECQLLRDEVIRLRDEIESARLSATAPSTLSPVKPRVGTLEAETMTVLPAEAPALASADEEAEVEAKAAEGTDRRKPKPSSLSAKSHSPCASPQSDQADSTGTSQVLLLPLQAEIKRLAKELTFLHQRNENLEFRLTNANKQLAESSANTVPTATFKASEQELASQVERALTAEKRLSDLQYNLERQSDVVKQLQHTHSCLTEDRDNVRHQYDCLLLKHKELEKSRNDLVVALQRQESSQASLSTNYEQMERTKERVCQEFDGLLVKYKTAEEDMKCAKELISELRQDCASACDRHLSSMDEHQRQTADLTRQLEDSRVSVARLTGVTDELRALLTVKQQEVEELTGRVQAAEKGESRVLPVENSSFVQPTDSVIPGDSSQVASGEAGPLSTPLADFVVSQLTVSQLTAAEIDPDSEADQHSPEVVQRRYKQALDCTEDMLSRLHASVNEEEQRWRDALSVSTTECRLLTKKVGHLETSLAAVMEERDNLARSLQQLQNQAQAADTDGHSVHSATSMYSSISLHRFVPADPSSADLGPTSSPHELLTHIGKLTHLVRVGRSALKQEQDKSAQLEAKLNSGKLAVVPSHWPPGPVNGAASVGQAVNDAAAKEDCFKYAEALTDTVSQVVSKSGTITDFLSFDQETAKVDVQTNKSCDGKGDVTDGSLVTAVDSLHCSASSDTLRTEPVI